MQLGFFGSVEIGRWREQLNPLLDRIEPLPRRSPIGQLVKSMISGRTLDATSKAAYDRLVDRFGTPKRMMSAKPNAVLECIAEVTFAEDKVRHVQSALRMIWAERGSFELSFLDDLPLEEALAWLERLPGVGRKVAASTLNASTLDRPVMIVDGHVQGAATAWVRAAARRYPRGERGGDGGATGLVGHGLSSIPYADQMHRPALVPARCTRLSRLSARR